MWYSDFTIFDECDNLMNKDGRHGQIQEMEMGKSVSSNKGELSASGSLTSRSKAHGHEVLKQATNLKGK